MILAHCAGQRNVHQHFKLNSVLDSVGVLRIDQNHERIDTLDSGGGSPPSFSSASPHGKGGCPTRPLNWNCKTSAWIHGSCTTWRRCPNIKGQSTLSRTCLTTHSIQTKIGDGSLRLTCSGDSFPRWSSITSQTTRSNQPRKAKVPQPMGLRDSRFGLAVWTRLELATPCVTGMYSNQLNYQT